ncbi:MAG TPA: ABC transporter permease [Methanotrichaceae archaeon]|nr:ABC transporter permease [Methanotrichaceae archaeon]HQF17503.1 ABC transporter permease [Methanotrichaceae archaeon]HQI92092.1 ABC transporter permease [Methanotrichaceae archaeon]HQJ29331.1 ABC transporter permease [Methanotrichaceae archaeon]
MMRGYILRRLAIMVPVLLCGSMITFGLVFLSPGDIGEMMADAEASAMGMYATQEMIDAINEHYGLNDPVHVQYLKWLKNALHGDLGRSFSSHRPVLREFTDHLVPTLVLNLAGIMIALCISIPLGVISAVKKNTIIDHLCRIYVLLEISMPTFWLALMLMWFFAFKYDLFPLYGYGWGWKDNLWHLVLPAVAMGTSMTGSLMRLTRTSMLETFGQEYIVTARAKGLGEFIVISKHALRNALNPVVTMVGLFFGHILTGSVIIETIFSWPGNGSLFLASINARDYPMIMGFTLIFMALFVIVTLITDISYTLLDPRIEYR